MGAYELNDAAGTRIHLDETNLALDLDDDTFVKEKSPCQGVCDTPTDDNGNRNHRYSVVEGKGGGDAHGSWLLDEKMFEHFKVWSRTSPSKHVRHLWATVKGGLPAGRYNLSIVQNSPIWTTKWKLPYKQ